MLQELGDFAGALARQARVVTVDTRELAGQRLIVGVTDEVQTDVALVAQIVQRLAQRFDVALRNVRDAGRETNRRDDIRQLHRRQPLRMHRPQLDAIARFLLQQVRIVRPRTQRLIGRQIALDCLAARRLDHVRRLRLRSQCEQRRNQQQEIAMLTHSGHLLSSRACCGGAPRRQNTSGSIVSL